MLDTFLKIIDRLISLINRKNNRRKDIFNEVLNPVFDELLLVHGDYLSMFEDMERQITKTLRARENKTYSDKNIKKDLEHTINTLREKRIQFEPIRIKLRVFALALKNQKLHKEEKEFLEAVTCYFPKGSLRLNRTSSSRIISKFDAWLEQMNEVGLDDNRKLESMGQQIRHTINEHKDTWSDACRKYAKLKIRIALL